MKLRSKLKLYFLLTSLIVKLKIYNYKIRIFKLLPLKRSEKKINRDVMKIADDVVRAIIAIQKEKYKTFLPA